MVKLGKFFKTGIGENIEVGEEGLSPPLCVQDSMGCARERAGSAAVHPASPEGTDKQDRRSSRSA